MARYLKGDGENVRLVATALRPSRLGGVGYLSEGIAVTPGERWRIFGKTTKSGVVMTGLCSGSSLLGSPSTTPFVAARASNVARDVGLTIVAALIGIAIVSFLRRRRTNPA